MFFALAPQFAGFSGVLAQKLELQPRDKTQVSMKSPDVLSFEGVVTETWDGGFDVKVRGERTPRSVDLADVSSLLRSRRLGGRAGKGALVGGGILGGTGFFLGYCVQILSSSSECAEDFDAAIKIGLPAFAIGAVIGAGIGAMFSRYSPFEAVDLDGSDPRSSSLDRFHVDLVPFPDGRIGLGMTLGIGGGR
jgi:hypothetical protein